MADKKISELTNITGANLADADEFVVVDTSASETKAITYGELKKFTGDVTVSGAITATGGDLDLATLDLSAIDTSIADTAVDVFVYDTSKDSDGGAWRKRTQHTSWYNETLNTATRGSRKEFPAVAVIVAEAAKVTIYDGDDPALPMWMVFNSGAGNALFINAGSSPTAVNMLNGELYVGLRNGFASAGLNNMSFAADTTSLRITSTIKYNVMSIAERNRGGVTTVDGSFTAGIVNRDVNDVAMTVLPNAPIDPATGLPVPTIAVATDGGVSVIKDDGNVWDITGSNWMLSARDLNFVGSDLYFTQTIYTVLAIDVNELNADLTGVADNSNTPPLRRVIPSGSYAIEFTQRSLALNSDNYTLARPTKRGNSTTDAWLNLTKEDKSDFTKGMSAFVSADFNTGWMNGDIKGAFLADTDDTDLVGSGELVTNGDFVSDVSGWTGNAATLTYDAGRIKVTNDGGSWGYAYQTITTVVGKTYVVAYDYDSLEATDVLIGTSLGGSQNLNGMDNSAGSGTATESFVATATTTYIQLRVQNPTAGKFGHFDNISVKLADADRSVNNNGLIVNGTVTRSPVATGADLVAYSGFTASNYLEQPYNSDLDFGTGDFCVMGWARVESTTAGERFALRREDGTNFSFHLNNSYGSYFSVGTGGGNYLSGTSLPLNVWKFVTFVRRSGVGYLYQDGVLNASANMLLTVNNATSPVTYLGVKSPSAGLSWLGSLALWRISATAPTAEQIKKIYEDEKVLFQGNAACTLYGASDAVTALAHDSDTGLLHVGTSAGRSVFQGLRRVSNTTTAVGTAISASNGLVVEE